MGTKRITIPFSHRLSPDDIRKMESGLLPEDMDDKWVGFLLPGSLEFYRSWTCFQIYHLPLVNGLLGPIYVVDDPNWYRGGEVERDIHTVKTLISWMLEEKT